MNGLSARGRLPTTMWRRRGLCVRKEAQGLVSDMSTCVWGVREACEKCGACAFVGYRSECDALNYSSTVQRGP